MTGGTAGRSSRDTKWDVQARSRLKPTSAGERSPPFASPGRRCMSARARSSFNGGEGSMAQILLMAHLILIAMGTGMSFSNLVNAQLSQSEQGDRFKALGSQRRVIAQIGDGVITLIWLTGIALIWLSNGREALVNN